MSSKLQSHHTILRDNILIQLRYLFGTSSRPDILYLIHVATKTGEGITSGSLTKLLGYHHSSIFRLLQSFEKGGIIEPRGEKRAKNTSWILSRPCAFFEKDTKEERIINWKLAVPVLNRLLLLAEERQIVENEDVFKHMLYTIATESLNILSQCGFGLMPTPPSQPLARVSAEEIADPLIKAGQAIIKCITGGL